MELSDKGDPPSAKSVGRVLKTMQGRIFGKLVLKGALDRTKTFAWKVVRVGFESSPAERAGFAGFDSSGSQMRAGARAHTYIPEAPERNPANPSYPASELDGFEGDAGTTYP
jgi:hypothetical protein